MGISPASPDSFYSSDQQVYISLEANQGFRFRRWEGDLEGTAKEGWVAMSTPRTVRALLDKVPYIPPSGVRNAVGETPVDGVAPGSLISVYGSQLAKKLEVGPNSPLSQTIGGTVVLVGERILPLIYVSPEQINAQLPYDLEEGTQKIVVKTEGLPDVEGSFRVVHNAPGLFVVDANDRKYALAFHEDGSQITSESPARRNEVITMLGTGFGPFSRRILEGFATPDTPTVSASDRVEIELGELRLAPKTVVAQPGMVGVVATRFRLSADVPRATELGLRVSSNAALSNTVLLPVE